MGNSVLEGSKPYGKSKSVDFSWNVLLSYKYPGRFSKLAHIAQVIHFPPNWFEEFWGRREKEVNKGVAI